MPAIKDISAIAEKWARVTPGRSADYAAGVQNPRKDWAKETEESAERQAAGVTAAISEDRFRKGVVQAGTEKWKRQALAKGVSRWGQGIQLAKQDYEAGFRPYAEAIRNLNLPARGPKGDPRNIERVRVIADTLFNLKRRMGG
jgi:hypothetical protein